jgi:hypothetical protein
MPINDNSLLSICIVTFNRSFVIRENLENLCPIAKKYNIPIYISDNASPDNTEDVVKEFKEKFENIYYFRQEMNVGYDRNAEFVLKQSSSKYRWLIGDKVIINELAIALLLDDLNSKDYDLYIVGDNKRKKEFTDEICTCKNTLLSEMGWYMTYTGSMIYNRRILENTVYDHYHDSGFIHMGIAFEYFNNNKFMVKMNPDIITYAIELAGNNKRDYWHNTTQTGSHCKQFFLFIMSLPMGYSFEAKRKCMIDYGKKHNFWTIKNLLAFRMKNLFSLKEFFKYRFFIKQTIIYPTFLLLCIACIPRNFIYIAVLIRNKLIGRS